MRRRRSAEIHNTQPIEPDSAVVQAEFMLALTAMQQSEFNEDLCNDSQLDAGSRKLHLFNQLEEYGVEPDRLLPEQLHAIEIVDMLFGYIVNAPGYSTRMQCLMASLQVPMLKAVLLDETFYKDHDHPVRQCLDMITQNAGLACRNTADQECECHPDKNQRCTLVHEMVQHVNQSFEEDVSWFEAFLVEYQAKVLAIDEREKEARANAPERSSVPNPLTMAQSMADRVINHALAQGENIPQSIKGLMDEGWRQALMTILLTHGSDSQEWGRAIRVAALITWAVTPGKTQPQKERLIGMQENILRAVKASLLKTEIPRTQIVIWDEALKIEIARVLAAPLSTASARMPEVQVVELRQAVL